MKTLLILLLLTACGQPKQEAAPVAEMAEETITEEPDLRSAQEKYDARAELTEEYIPQTIADLDFLRILVSDYDILGRLIKVQDNLRFNAYTAEGDIVGKRFYYGVVYMDPVDYTYYFGKVLPTNFSLSFVQNLDYSDVVSHPQTNLARLYNITNLSPSHKIILDTFFFPEETNLYIQIIQKTPDPYYFREDSSKIDSIAGYYRGQSFYGLVEEDFPKIKLIPQTNTEAFHPITYKPFIEANPAFNEKVGLYHFIRDYDTGDIKGPTEFFPDG